MGNAATAGGSSMVTLIVYIVAMLAIFYFLLIRPQKKKEKEARLMMEALRVGDKIVTIGGIYGKITQLKEDTLIMETGAPRKTSAYAITPVRAVCIKIFTNTAQTPWFRWRREDSACMRSI